MVCWGIRILVNPQDPRDMKQVHDLQDTVMVEQKSSGKFEIPNFDPVSQKKVRDDLTMLGTTIADMKSMFGKRSEVDPVRHLIGSAILWGGVPTENSEISGKSRVLRITELMSPACLSSSDQWPLCSPADSVVGRLWN